MTGHNTKRISTLCSVGWDFATFSAQSSDVEPLKNYHHHQQQHAIV